MSFLIKVWKDGWGERVCVRGQVCVCVCLCVEGEMLLIGGICVFSAVYVDVPAVLGHCRVWRRLEGAQSQIMIRSLQMLHCLPLFVAYSLHDRYKLHQLIDLNKCD